MHESKQGWFLFKSGKGMMSYSRHSTIPVRTTDAAKHIIPTQSASAAVLESAAEQLEENDTEKSILFLQHSQSQP